MTEVKIEKHGTRLLLVVTGFRHGFLSEDETCAEFSMTKKDAKILANGVRP